MTDRTTLRHARLQHLYEAIKAAIIYAWQRAAEDHLTHQQVLDYIRFTLPVVSGDRSKLDKANRLRLEGVEDTMFLLHRRDHLTFCYPHPDTGVPTPAVVLGEAGILGRVDSRDAEDYYKNADGTFTDKF